MAHGGPMPRATGSSRGAWHRPGGSPRFHRHVTRLIILSQRGVPRASPPAILTPSRGHRAILSGREGSALPTS